MTVRHSESPRDDKDGGETTYEFVESLPDLIDASEYGRYPDGGLVKLRITVTESGVELLGDGMRPEAVEALLTALGGDTMEQMLCG
ncbi:radical SAM-modified peptide, FtsH ternary system-associated [Streptosporangium sp. H16]|uniref:radical SAM-modified peptide, FtsH ternary system-associated n=1 Tax=Streptosporangium sp. H16 TaxID=3444184 RepID=UPI003F7AD00B